MSPQRIQQMDPQTMSIGTTVAVLGPWTHHRWSRVTASSPPHFLHEGVGVDPRHPNELRIVWADNAHTVAERVEDWDGCYAYVVGIR